MRSDFKTLLPNKAAHSVLEEQGSASLSRLYHGVVTRLLGFDNALEVETTIQSLEAASALILCSDGAWRPLSESGRSQQFRETNSIDAALEVLQIAYHDAGSPSDDASIIAIEFDS